MRLLLVASMLSLAGCPSPPRYIATEVVSARAPVQDALVAADCGGFDYTARRTDALGRARLVVPGNRDLTACSMTVAMPGFHTVEVPIANACTAPFACPPSLVWLRPDFVAMAVPR